MLNTQALALVVLEKKIFPIMRLLQILGCQGMVNLDPWGMVGRIYEGDYKHCYIQNTEALGLMASEKMFLIFHITSHWELSVAMETTILIQSVPKSNTINPPIQ